MDAAATQLVLNRIARAFDEDVQLTRDQEAKIRDAAISRKVLGGNHKLRRNPRDYAQSPLIKHIKKNCKSSGTIYVAYVPNNNGKTTACYACMDTARRGIVFSPSTMQVGSYFDSMVRSLGFEYEDPPRGFMIRILDELEDADPDPEISRNILILDNCMPQGYVPEDGRYIDDLKGHIKERNVTALILTSNKETACRLIAQNSLEEIVPLVSFTQLDELRRANPTIDPLQPLVFDWEKEVSMVWDKDELKKALEHSIFFPRARCRHARYQSTLRRCVQQAVSGREICRNPDLYCCESGCNEARHFYAAQKYNADKCWLRVGRNGLNLLKVICIAALYCRYRKETEYQWENA